jgi:cytochrome d ubiquinol oxidase subunit II
MPTGLEALWFSLIGLLWAGYFLLEGFDFGVGMISPVVSRDGTDRRLCLNSIGPVWDGNEVWLIVAGGATFAAFPLWYARLFSGAYLALFVVLLALIVRNVSFEFRHRIDSVRWRHTWDTANAAGSLVAALIWGVAFTDLAHGLPLSPAGYSGGLVGLLHPVALLGGLAAVAIFALHGSVFLSLKTTGELRRRARRSAGAIGGAAVVLLAGTITWIAVQGRPWGTASGAVPAAVPLGGGLLAVTLLAAATLAIARAHEGLAFTATGAAVLLSVGAVWAFMYPMALPASSGSAAEGVPGLSIAAAASQPSTLTVMTIAAAIFTPFVLLYQGWTYWVFRHRLSRPPEPGGPGGAAVTPPPGSPSGAPSDGGPAAIPPGAGPRTPPEPIPTVR